MIRFKELTLSDKDKIQSYTLYSDRQNCDLVFANLCSWRFLYHTVWTEMDGFLVLKFRTEDGWAYMLPVGHGDLKKVLADLMADARECGHPFRMFGICNDTMPEIELLMPEQFRFSIDRNYADYIYSRESLATLQGKKLQPKRNHINRFKNMYSYEYLPLSPDLVPECLALERKWFRANTEHEQRALLAEKESMTYALKHLDRLDITGGVLCVEGNIAAFTFGAPVNQTTFDVCVEKADVSIEGAYTMINNEFVKHLPEQYVYINREEDLGIEGLRAAKISYQPVCILEKYVAELKTEVR